MSIVLITGGNTGLGYETVKALLSSDVAHHVLLGSRSLAKAEDAAKQLKSEVPQTKGQITTVQIDVEDDASIEKAVDFVSKTFGHLDTLINNAGAQFDPEIYKEGSTVKAIRQYWNKTWDVNVTGANILTHLCVPLLLKSSHPRILFITSGLSSLTYVTDPLPELKNGALWQSVPAGWPKNFLGVPAYRSAKTGLNMVTAEWHRALQNDGVKVFSISPGLLATGLGGNPEMLKKMGALSPEVGGNFMKDVTEGKRDADAGKVVQEGGTVRPW